MLKANIVFEAKRLKYSFSGAKREDLLAEIEGYNARLQDVLSSNDRISALTQQSRSPTSRRVSSKYLNFWKHAASIFRVLDNLWSCSCRSKAYLWLQHHAFTEVNMRMQLRLCHGKQSMHVRLSDAPPTLQIGGGKASRSNSSLPSVMIQSSCMSSTSTRLWAYPLRP